MSAGQQVVVGPPDMEHTLVPVPGADLHAWAAWIGWITGALENAAETTRFDLARRLPAGVTLPELHAALGRAEERIGALLDGEGWWDPR